MRGRRSGAKAGRGTLVVGADAFPGGWICVAVDGAGVAGIGAFAQLALALGRWPGTAVLGVDIPIGLPTAGERRRADLEARRFVGPRWASVWLTPPRQVLETPWSAGLGYSKQAHGMGGRIFEVERLADPRVREVHPEVVFAHLSGRAGLPPKRTWSGMWRRLELLAAAGLELPRGLPVDVAADDLVDAAAVAWAARRAAAGESQTLPADPEPGEPVICY